MYSIAMAAAYDYRIEIFALSKEDGGGFLAIAPDLPGCFADGWTQREALANLRDAIAEWIADAPQWVARCRSRNSTRPRSISRPRSIFKALTRRVIKPFQVNGFCRNWAAALLFSCKLFLRFLQCGGCDSLPSR